MFTVTIHRTKANRFLFVKLGKIDSADRKETVFTSYIAVKESFLQHLWSIFRL
jgi:hypothetical protein